MNGETNSIEYGHCIYDKFINLLDCVEKGTISEYAREMFANVEAKTTVETE